MTKQNKNLLSIGIDVYSVGLSCSTVIYSYYAYFYSQVLEVSWILHLLLFFLLPVFGCMLYFLIFGFKSFTAKLAKFFYSEDTQNNNSTQTLIPTSTFAEMNNEEKIKLIKDIKNSMD